MPNRPHSVMAVIAVGLSIALLILGTSLLAFPSKMVGILLWGIDDVFPDLSAINNRILARLAGGILASLSLLNFLLAAPALLSSKNDTISTKAQCQAALTSQGLSGLLLILLFVLELIEGDELIAVLLVGALVTLLASIGLMASFWGQSRFADDSAHMIQTETDLNGNDLSEPLLGRTISDEENLSSLGEDNDGQSPEDTYNVYPPIPSHNVSGSTHPSSRITGTRRLMKLAAPQMFYLYLGCIVLLIRLPFSISIPHFVSTTLGALSRQEYDAALRSILLLFTMGSIDAALDFWCVFLFGYAKERIVKEVRLDTFKAVLNQEVSFFDATTSGELSSRLSSDCGEVAGDLTWFFRFSIESTVRIIGIVTYMMVRCPTLGLCAVSIVPFVGFINTKYGQWLGKNAKSVQSALADANSTSQEAFSCIRTVIAFASEETERKKYRSKIDEYYRLNIRQLYMTGIYYMFVSTFLINTVVQALLLYIGALLIRQGRLSTEILLAFMLYQGSLNNETQNLLNSYTSLIKSSGAGDRVFAILDRKPFSPGTGSPDVICSGETGDRDDGTHTRSFCGDVEFKDVSFSYASRPNHQILKNLSLKIPGGSTYALVGPSGGGKSTVINLLERFYDPTEGSVLVGKKDLKQCNIKEHRRSLSIVTQEPLLFSGSVKDNILYGYPEATQEDMINAAKLANAHSFILSFPDGYATLVGERGTQLSGGQRQRIVIARAILKRPSILLLDEATSALDSESERIVQGALDNLMASRDHSMTTIVIAHRLQTVRDADIICVVNDGRVFEEGSHDELMQRKESLYRKMVERTDGHEQLDDAA